MSKQRGTFFGLSIKLISMMKWQGKQDDKENQKYGSPMYIPRRKKRKGYQKSSQLSTFNKNR